MRNWKIGGGDMICPIMVAVRGIYIIKIDVYAWSLQCVCVAKSSTNADGGSKPNKDEILANIFEDLVDKAGSDKHKDSVSAAIRISWDACGD